MIPPGHCRTAVLPCLMWLSINALLPLPRARQINRQEKYIWWSVKSNTERKNGCQPELWSKALNGIQWEVAHPLSLNYGVPIASMDAAICVSGGGTPYVGLTKGSIPMLWSGSTADTYGCIHGSNRCSVI